jgi:hypothetical protein
MGNVNKGVVLAMEEEGRDCSVGGVFRRGNVVHIKPS